MSVITEPTVGRKVWYRPSEQDASGPVPMVYAYQQPLDATIVAVHGTRMVNLVIFDYMGNMFRKFSVTLVQDGDAPPARDIQGRPYQGYAEWMPYQKAQAAKHAEKTE